MRTPEIYGTAPVDLGLIDLSPTEMMFWLYCPIKLPYGHGAVPENLLQYRPLIEAVHADCYDRWEESFIYVTAKTLHVSSGAPGNRPGWHSDGFLTDDLNYIWCDANPTVFYEGDRLHSFAEDHNASLTEMDVICDQASGSWKRYPVKHLLRLDQTVLHKVDDRIAPGVRTFVKISVSSHRYALKGNSINHRLATDWVYGDRQAERNCPILGAKDGH